jgi:hypothetical protein
VTDEAEHGATRRAKRTPRAAPPGRPSPSAASGLRADPQAPKLRRRQSPLPAKTGVGPPAATAARHHPRPSAETRRSIVGRQRRASGSGWHSPDGRKACVAIRLCPREARSPRNGPPSRTPPHRLPLHRQPLQPPRERYPRADIVSVAVDSPPLPDAAAHAHTAPTGDATNACATSPPGPISPAAPGRPGSRGRHRDQLSASRTRATDRRPARRRPRRACAGRRRARPGEGARGLPAGRLDGGSLGPPTGSQPPAATGGGITTATRAAEHAADHKHRA